MIRTTLTARAVCLGVFLTTAGTLSASPMVSITVFPTDDNWVSGNSGGLYDQLGNTANFNFDTYNDPGGKRRFALEFPYVVAPLGLVLDSATLSLTPIGSAAPAATFVLHGYSGDGVVAVPDASVTNPIATSVSTTAAAAIDVTAFVAAQSPFSTTHYGFMGSSRSLITARPAFFSMNNTNQAVWPSLTLVFIPEPSSIVLLTLAMAFGAQRPRRC